MSVHGDDNCRPPAPLADGRKFHEGSEGPGVCRRVDHRGDDGGGAEIENTGGNSKLANGNSDDAGLAGQSNLSDAIGDGRDIIGAVLHIEGYSVEIFAGEHAGDHGIWHSDPCR